MGSRRLLSLLVLVFVLAVAPLCSFAQQEENHENVPNSEAVEGNGEKKKLDVSSEVFSHVGDAHSWHIFSMGEKHVTVPLPVILYSPEKGLSVFSSANFGHFEEEKRDGKTYGITESYNGYHIERGIKEKVIADDGSKVYDFSITKNVLCMLLAVVILLLLMTSVGSKYKKNAVMTAPSGFQNALEPVITFIRDEVAKPNLGNRYMRYMPMLLTVFFFIWINNLLGLLPFGFNFTGNIAVTLCLSIVSFIVMVVSANKHFWGHLFNPPGVPFGIKLLLVPIEIISLFIKPVALTIRLFANMLAGHIVILSVIFMIFIFGNMSPVAGWGFSIVSVAFAIFMFLLELLVAAIQAFIFANLTAVFIGQAIEEPHHDHDHHHHGEAVNDTTGQGYHVSANEIIA
ncbi:MAG: ATP synthase F0 subunit A [Bacteroidetes bacterium 43-93]|nr:F0F1 ATP synthase subunit A [Bacteroidota bacterium]OJW99470.1 MAG: ATP synthase F0 subunit A [Bacteroidetes bacterium 43-93]